ncbi:MAG: DUF362 domain-containing protein [Proteobacteria bacterium]|nr:DUF362 domain-containing protein [Cystobacterineae bacterium]MCL2259131.1 DUF362 domain-containing protein [Cystobacterineae bacterium]MCL2315296.1 DUF362 domain-containing protein [Pseudomonadota bacterium]
MKRRDFLKSMGAGLAIGAGFSLEALGNPLANPQAPFDLVAVMGGEPEVMFEKGIAALGGMGRFVKAGQKVVVKPNIGWDKAPELAANTNPKLVGRVVRACLEAGAKEVFVFDNTCDNWQKAYATSGIEKAAKEAGAKVLTGNSEGNYKEVSLPKGKSLKTAKVHEKIMECDVFVNVPILKHHNGAQVTFAMKNLMGIVWDRRYWHRNDLQQCIADMVSFRKPDLNIVDAYRVMKKNGPKGVSLADVSLEKAQILSADIVAADAAAAKIFGAEPQTIGHIKIASEMGLGVMELSKLNIHRMKV